MKQLRLISTLACLLASPALAYNVEPMIAELRPSGPAATKVFTVENTDEVKVAVQVSATSRGVDLDGKEVRKETSHFVIYPDQLVINPKEKRSVRVTYTGPRDLTTEMAYRITFGELPVTLKKPDSKASGAQINFMFNYNTAVYVGPPGTKPEIMIESQNRVSQDKIEVLFANKGTAHQTLNRFDYQLIEGTSAFPLGEEDKKVLGSQNLLANSKVKITLHVPAEARAKKGLRLDMKPKP